MLQRNWYVSEIELRGSIKLGYCCCDAFVPGHVVTMVGVSKNMHRS